MGRTYKCEECGGTFEAAWSEEEALAEKKELWGDFPLELCAQVCDDCFKETMKGIHESDNPLHEI